MTGDLPTTQLEEVSPSQPELAVLDLSAQLARTSLVPGDRPPQGTLVDLIQLAAGYGMPEERVMLGLQFWQELEALQWSEDGS
eukprot:9670299-Alexandrium_andersonii.AAC.1